MCTSQPLIGLSCCSEVVLYRLFSFPFDVNSGNENIVLITMPVSFTHVIILHSSSYIFMYLITLYTRNEYYTIVSQGVPGSN